jgi:DNA recombination protein RmuC
MFVLARVRTQAQIESVRSKLTIELAAVRERAARLPELEATIDELRDAQEAKEGQIMSLARAEAEKGRLLESTERQLLETRERLAATDVELTNLKERHAALAAQLEAERRQAEEKLKLLHDAKDALSHQFKTLANDILEEKSKRFAEQNQTSLGQLLEPLKTKLTEFQTKVEHVYVNESKDRSALGEQVRQLIALNQTLSADAKNLTQALKGSNKVQGNYGELVLERLLEAAGLRKGEEYEVQVSLTREDGTRAQPDVVIRLPENRNLVVDSKVSLLAYEEAVSAVSDEERDAAIARHVASVRAHLKGLAERNYHSLYQLKSLDFVLMFVPIEPAFMLAVTHDRNLFMDAWERNVLLVSPSTLMFAVRTVAHLWRQEQQSRNAQEIAKRGAELYDRLVAFVADLEKVGERLRQAQDSFNDARDRLAKNKGNVIRQAEMLKQLGARPTKKLPQELVDAATEEESEAEELTANEVSAVVSGGLAGR